MTVLLALVFSGCGVPLPEAVEVKAPLPPAPVAVTAYVNPGIAAARVLATQQQFFELLSQQRFVLAVYHERQHRAAEQQSKGSNPGDAGSRRSSVSAARPVYTQSSGNYSSVVQCVKAHESGNYNESSHPGAGSGAYQFVPNTWRHYAAASGLSNTRYAYQASPAQQDGVFQYAITHGGAHNWDPSYGNDPCTVNLP